MADQTRRYEMKRRAASQQRTRERITESAVALHGTLGPARTTMSAVAEHAGVRRSTLYRHFPDEAALFDACSAHWSTANPPPDLFEWAQIEDAEARLQRGLHDLYGYYARTESMLENLLRDEASVQTIAERFGAFHGFLAAAAEALIAGRALRGAAKARTRAALGHAVAFSTWKSLVREQALSEHAAVELMAALVAAAARGRPRSLA